MAVSRRTERYELVVIGGGQAGLAAGYWLARHDIDFLIVDAYPRVGDAWRNRWDTLRLFTPARYSALPALAFPGDPYHFPAREEVADYLEWYASVFELPVRSGVTLSQLRRELTGFTIATDDVTLEADNVIVATGPMRTPRVPAFASELDPAIVQLHSSDFRNPAQLPAGPVLVVGAGNSGAQIALELARSRDVTLAGRDVGSIPRRLFGRDVFDWLAHTLMIPGADSFVGRRMRSNVLGGTDALIGMSEGDLRVPGLRRVGRITEVKCGAPYVGAKKLGSVASIIWCTGYRPDYSWIDLPVVDDRGFPQHQRGVTRVPGLYFLGLRFQHRLNSSLLGGVGTDAQYIADVVAARYGHPRSHMLLTVRWFTQWKTSALSFNRAACCAPGVIARQPPPLIDDHQQERPMLRSTLFIAAIAVGGYASSATAQQHPPQDSIAPRFSIGATHAIAGYIRLSFPSLDSRIAAAGLPRVGGAIIGVGAGTDIRMRRLLLGGGFQTLLPRTRDELALRSRLSGSHVLADVGYAVVRPDTWSVYPIGGLGVTHLSLDVRERGDFDFDDGLGRPTRELLLSGTAALLHTGMVIEHRFHIGTREFAMNVRGGMTQSIGRQRWLSHGSTVNNGPSGIRGSYLRVEFSKPIRRWTDGALQLGATAVRALVQ